MTPVANILQPLIDVADAILRFWHDTAGLGWGLSIVMLTVVVRIAILPLTYKGVKGMQNMQRLAPEMKKLQERYKDDKQRLNEEMMKFYQEHGFNPASSCLPLLLQIPFFISLFYLLRDEKFERYIQGEESFLIISNLAEPESGLALVVLALLFVATQLAAGLVTAISAERTQRLLVLVLPIVFVPILISFESGLLVYWITTNIWTFGQQLAVKKFLPAPEPLSLGDGDGKESRGARPKTAKPAASAAASADGSGGGKRRAPLAAVSASGGGDTGGEDPGAARRPPPRSPRKKKKRSGRRR
ncbi:MAG: YidC/Oxa1 family membrane protein insertase [Actinomycetota bacterium]|nr:YidC/Oxa1 family membrane protein insertase [Actinomycetota bacterium]